jgi:hypothetical protein
MEPLTGDDPSQIAGYRLRGRLGAGGMGVVYLGLTPAGRAVAVKVMRPELGDDHRSRDRFRHEVEAARRVHGLYTAQVVDADPTAMPPWLVTAYVPGPSLQQAVADHGPMPAQTVGRLMAGVAEALQAIHAAGVIHRDLKPSNVLLAADGPRVIDFGIARAPEATALTRSGFVMGSPQFMAPEQVEGQPATPATDIFALGSLAAYAVLGRAPFGDGPSDTVLYRILHTDPDLTACPMPLRTVIERCMAKDPAHRLQPAEIIGLGQAQLGRGQGPSQATESALSWLPPGVAADVAYRGTLVATVPGQAAPADGAVPVPPAVATWAEAGLPRRPVPPAVGTWPAAGPPQPGLQAQMPRIYPPSSVVAAARLMYVSAAIAALNTIVNAAVAYNNAYNWAENQANANQNSVTATAKFEAIVVIFFGLAVIGMWLWMAYANRNGRSWARTLSMVLFAIFTVLVPLDLIAGPNKVAAFVALIQWPIALAVVLLLWDRQSSAYFAAMRRPAFPYPAYAPYPPYPPWAGYGPPPPRSPPAQYGPAPYGQGHQPGRW